MNHRSIRRALVGSFRAAALVVAAVASAFADASMSAPVPSVGATGPSAGAPARYTFHYQATVTEQGDARVPAGYTGQNSFQPDPQRAVSVTATLFLGMRLLPGTEVYLNPELSGGRGLSDVFGLGAPPNGETYRVGSTAPVVSTARLFVRQVFGLNSETEKIEDGPNQIVGTAATERVTIVAGKFSLPDYFDGNAYAHDPRSQFSSWALMGQEAWDYPADTRGYTWGLMAEYRRPAWSFRGALVAEPKVANMLDMDRRIGRANGSVIEGEHDHELAGRKGAVRLAAFLNQAHMGSYDQALADARRTGTTPDIIHTEAYGHTKYGFSFNADQELADSLGGFMRLGWSDGRNETWAFAEVDSAESLGVEWTPKRWGRDQDRWGVGTAFNELSGPHRRYLSAGGYGFALGDGGMHYGPEMVLETYYRIAAREHLFVSPDYQFIVNPGYNRARGPVQVYGVRVHAEF